MKMERAKVVKVDEIKYLGSTSKAMNSAKKGEAESVDQVECVEISVRGDL